MFFLMAAIPGHSVNIPLRVIVVNVGAGLSVPLWGCNPTLFRLLFVGFFSLSFRGVWSLNLWGFLY